MQYVRRKGEENTLNTVLNRTRDKYSKLEQPVSKKRTQVKNKKKGFHFQLHIQRKINLEKHSGSR